MAPISHGLHTENDEIEVEELERLLLEKTTESQSDLNDSSELRKLESLLAIDETKPSELKNQNEALKVSEVDELQLLLEAANEIETSEKKRVENNPSKLREVSLFENENNENESETMANYEKISKEIFGDEDIDSSDDEEVKNFLERKYNEYGRDINKKLKQQQEEKSELKITKEVNQSVTGGFSSTLVNSMNQDENNANNTQKSLLLLKKLKTQNSLSNNFTTKASETSQNITTSINSVNALNSSVYTDPVFGMRVVNPLISSEVLLERMNGRKAVGMNSISFHTQRGDLSKDWVVAGAIVNKSPVKTAKNGSSFSIWRISDLKGDIKMISVFLFKNAHKELWKTAVGMVVAILNPRVFDKNQQKGDAACLSIDSAQKVMIIGQSKDLGTCKAKKKNGDICGAVINLGECDFCVYHLQQEYGQMSKRSELQSATAGRGLNALRNKVLGKSEVFYGGQSYTAIPARKSVKQEAKDKERLMTLSEYLQMPKTDAKSQNIQIQAKKDVPYASPSVPKSKMATSVETNGKQRLKDLERLKVLKADGKDEQSKDKPLSDVASSLIPEKFRNKEFSFSQKIPTLSKESFTIELNLSERKAELSKLKALQIINKKPIEKSDPNFIRYRGTTEGKKRVIDVINSCGENEAKRKKLSEEEETRKTRIQKIMEATSSHIDLIQSRQNEEQEKYFKKMEKKEALEEKMLQTYKVPCKAVICLKCKYTAFSAADRCKEEKHPFKVIDAEKRFFECQDCGNRTVTVYKIPKLSCKNCQSSKWKRAAMIRDKKTIDSSANLSIRGDEEKYLGSLATTTNLNLLVPNEDNV